MSLFDQDSQQTAGLGSVFYKASDLRTGLSTHR